MEDRYPDEVIEKWAKAYYLRKISKLGWDWVSIKLNCNVRLAMTAYERSRDLMRNKKEFQMYKELFIKTIKYLQTEQQT